MNEDLVFETDRLILRPLTEEDAYALYELLRDVDTSTKFGNRHLTDVEEAKLFIGLNEVGPGSTPGELCLALYGIFSKEAGTFLGCLQVYPKMAGDSYVDGIRCLAYALLPEYRGRGYATEAVNGMVAFLMENILELGTVSISFFTWNRASLAVARRCGFRFDHATKQSYHSGEGNIEDEEHWVLTRIAI